MSAGRGKPGFCKICVHPASQFLNARVEREGKDVFNAARAAELAQTIDPDFKFNRQTWYSHLEHITHPLVTAAENAKKSPVVVPKTNTGVLEAIRDIGMKNAVEHPEDITVDHALKAAAELNKRQTGTDDVIVVFAKIMSGEQPAEIVVGEWSELPSSQEDPIPNGQ